MKKHSIFYFLFYIAMTATVGCSAMQYAPEEYVIAESRIPQFPSSGTISFENAQTSKNVIKVFTGGAGAESNLNAITAGLITQLKGEIAKRHGKIADNGEKTFKISVTNVMAHMAFFTLKSEMQFTVVLGNGTTESFLVRNTSPGNLPRTLNGNIAKAVIEILTRPSILAYLK